MSEHNLNSYFDLAKFLELPPVSGWRALAGAYTPRDATLERIAEAFDVPLLDIYELAQRPSDDPTLGLTTLSEFLDAEMSRMYGGHRPIWSTHELSKFMKEMDPTGEGISQGTAWRLLDQPSRIPKDLTLEKISVAFDVVLPEIRMLADRPPGEREPFRLPAEANQLTNRQRDVVIEMIWALLDAATDGRRVTR
jgi:hypothetical protein